MPNELPHETPSAWKKALILQHLWALKPKMRTFNPDWDNKVLADLINQGVVLQRNDRHGLSKTGHEKLSKQITGQDGELRMLGDEMQIYTPDVGMDLVKLYL